MNIGGDDDLPLDGEPEDISHEIQNELEDEEQDDGQGDLSAEQHSTEEDDAAQTRQEGQQERQVRNRGENRFQTLANRTREAEERALRAERAVEELRRNNQTVSQQEQERQERERYALMTPDEQIRYDLRRAEERSQNAFRQMQLQMHEQNDFNNFNSIIQRNPRLEKYKDEVLRTAQGLRTQGNYVPREMILDYLIGKEVREKGLQAAGKQAQRGKQRIASQTVRPNSSRSDVNTRTRQLDDRTARVNRLSNIEI